MRRSDQEQCGARSAVLLRRRRSRASPCSWRALRRSRPRASRRSDSRTTSGGATPRTPALAAREAQAVQHRIAACMAALGLPYIEFVEPAPEIPDADLGPRDWAAKWGFGVSTSVGVADARPPVADPNLAHVETLPPAEGEAYRAALFGTVSSRGCSGDANVAIYSRHDRLLAGLAAELAELEERIAADPRTVDADARWRSCVSSPVFRPSSRRAFGREAIDEIGRRLEAIMGPPPGVAEFDRNALERLQAFEIDIAVRGIDCDDQVRPVLESIRLEARGTVRRGASSRTRRHQGAGGAPRCRARPRARSVARPRIVRAMTRILVTGGGGYVGSVSAAAFLTAGHEVVVVDDLTTGHRAAVPTGTRLHVGSYGDEEAMVRLLTLGAHRGDPPLRRALTRRGVHRRTRQVLPRQRRGRRGAARGGPGRRRRAGRLLVLGRGLRHARPDTRSPRMPRFGRSTRTARRSGRSSPPSPGTAGPTGSGASACATSTWRARPRSSARTTTRRPTSSPTSWPRPRAARR